MFSDKWKKEIFTIPNLLSLVRLALIPVYICLYLGATGKIHYLMAGSVLAFSCMTDIADGIIARRFQMITQVGKVLDPLADKLTQFSLILCLCQVYPALYSLLTLFVTKESFQLIAMLLNFRKGQVLDGALLSGKISTTVLFIGLIIFVLFPDMNTTTMWIITGICFVFLLIAFVDYIRAYYGKNKKLHNMEEM